MKKIIVMTAVFVISSLAIFAQTSNGKKTDSSMHKVYTCTMHPEVISDKPGKCPKCGMDLVEKKSSGHTMDPGIQKMPMHKKDSTMGKMKMPS